MQPFSKRNHQIINGIINNKKLVNSYIFYGQTGAFIPQAAKYLALGANCLDFSSNICGVCVNCKSIEKEAFPDLITVSSDKKITVDQIRKIQESVKYGPSHGKYLVVIIKSAHNLTTEAANAFLKTLEEPPDNVCFILLTNNLLSLLPTIRSRCQQLDFPTVGKKDQEAYLDYAFDDEAKKNILEKCFHNKDLISHFLENKEYLESSYISYEEIIAASIEKRLKVAETIAKNKKQALTLLSLWLGQIMEKSLNENETATSKEIKNMELTIENISQMKYNLNLKLHLETLLINL
jgi:DNA polymerase III delta prime subunit